MKHLIMLMSMLLLYSVTFSQERQVSYRHDLVPTTNGINGKTYKFTIANEPPLKAIPGKEDKAGFEYYWEFGDGYYLITTDKTVTHTYTTSGTKEVILKTIGVYDDGDPPSAITLNGDPNVQITNAGISLMPLNKLSSGETFEIDINHSNRDVVPNEDNVIIMKYKNVGQLNKSGQLYLFYNEKETGENGNDVPQFNLIGSPRIYNETNDIVSEQYVQGGLTKNISNSLFQGNTKTKNTLKQSKNRYKNYMIFDFDGLQPLEQSNIFLTLQTDANIGDIEGEEVKIKGVLVSGMSKPDTTSIDLAVAKAHDPNRITVSETRENFRRVQNRELTYKVQFQNDGKAPAKDVEVTIEIPEGLEIDKVKFLEKEFKMKHLKNSPDLKKCPSADGPCYRIDISKDDVKFIFERVYLPGLKEPDVEKYKETVGTFKYKIKYRNKLKKEPLASRAHIVFKDDFGAREPVITDYTTTRFKPGLSLGPKAGVSWDLEYQTPTFFVGVVASPYKSNRFYLQVEGLVNYGQFSCDGPVISEATGDTIPNNCILINYERINGLAYPDAPSEGYTIEGPDTIQTEHIKEIKNFRFSIPIQIRKDINSLISVGLGAEVGIEYRQGFILQTRADRFIVERYNVNGEWELVSQPNVLSLSEPPPIKKNATHFTSSVFADVLIGKVKAGPAIGLRYLRDVTAPKITGDFTEFTSGKNRLQAFAQWKF